MTIYSSTHVQHHYCYSVSMNFWEFKEDYSQGYYLPVSNKAAFHHGRQLTRAVFSFVAFVFKLVLSLLAAAWLFIFTIFRLILRLAK